MLAYLHTHFNGFIPCRVTARGRDAYGPTLTVTLTSKRGDYAKGETLTVAAGSVVARPLRVSRQSTGRLYGFTPTPQALDAAGVPFVVGGA